MMAQDGSATNPAADASNAAKQEKKKRGPVFRPTKAQIKQVQELLKEKAFFTGEANGKYSDATRDAIKGYQKDYGLKETATLNRVTLEKMGIELTESQKKIPVAAASDEPEAKPAKASKASKKDEKAEAAEADKPKRSPIFRATSDQVKEAQKILKSGSMYEGDQTGKLDDATRTGLKKYQEANGLKGTGTLNRVTLEKMGIELTEKQKATPGGK